MATFRWGMIGASGWADHTFGPAIERARGNALVAVLGSKSASAKAYAGKHAGVTPYTDIGAFLEHPGMDAVWVASPPDIHQVYTVTALAMGKHVLCEKPMAVTVADCRAMVRAATRAKRELRIGFNNRSHPELQKLAKAVAAGRFGEALEARVQVYYPYPAPPPAWRQQRKRSGGWAIGDIGTHLLDVLRWIMNAEAKKVAGHLSNRCWGFKTDDHAQVTVTFDNGAIGSITACTGAAGGDPRVEFYGTKGYFILRGALFGAPGELEIGLKGKAATRTPVAAFDTYKAEVELFAAQAGGRATSLASGLDGLANIGMVERARGWAG